MVEVLREGGGGLASQQQVAGHPEGPGRCMRPLCCAVQHQFSVRGFAGGVGRAGRGGSKQQGWQRERHLQAANKCGGSARGGRAVCVSMCVSMCVDMCVDMCVLCVWRHLR
jgi:hypothetical protein